MSTSSTSRRHASRPRDLTEEQFDRLLGYSYRFAVIFIGLVVAVVALQASRVIVMPVMLAVIVGLMFGPVADRLESRGLAPALSAAIVVLLFIAIILGGITAFAVPLSDWVERAPEIWRRLQAVMADWQQPLEALGGLQEQLRSVFGNSSTVAVTVEEGGPITDAAMMAPGVLTEILVFLISLYFYIATRDHIRMSVLALCATRRMRWRTAHVFSDVEQRVSRFLLVVTADNFVVGVLIALMTWALGLPSPMLWGAMAFVLNYIPYVGQAIMAVVLVAVGFATHEELIWALAPVIGYGIINFIDGNIVFPAIVGRGVSLNPFLVFLSITFWIWAWGPFGALVAVPILLIITSFLSHVVPIEDTAPLRPVRRRANMTDRELVLANAAAAIRERADKAKAEAQAAEAAAVAAREEAERAEKAKAEQVLKLAETPAPRKPRARRPRKASPEGAGNA